MSEIRIAGAVERLAAVTINVDGKEISAAPGESVAAALLAAGVRRLGESFRAGTPRGAFCFMGVCQECLVQIDGVAAQACLTPVRNGMNVLLKRI